MDLRWLFLDMNSFFASCEQQDRAELRSRPIAVAPVASDSTCCIAASYEARRFGIKCGTNIGVARQMCPELTVVSARPELYTEYHTQILQLLRSMLPEVRKLSCDEMACRLGGNEKSDSDAVRLGREIKLSLKSRIGECMRCSVGLAPNAFLAKVATELHKPDGLVAIRASDLPHALYGLKLSDFPGIGRKMLVRLHGFGIYTVEDMYAADSRRLRLAWGGVSGERWYRMLRGDADCDYGAMTVRPTQSVGHSHVLAPEMRNLVGAESVLLRLTARAVRRLRLKGMHARAIAISVRFTKPSGYGSKRWSASSEHRIPASDPFSLVAAARSLWQSGVDTIAANVPIQVAMVFCDLIPSASVTLPLFDESHRGEIAAQAMDGIHARFGKTAIDLGSVFFERAGMREAIAFGKVTDDDREERDGIFDDTAIGRIIPEHKSRGVVTSAKAIRGWDTR
jgi:DNA polymerase-4